MPRSVADVETISIASGLRERSRKEELAFDHAGHFHEYVFNQTLAPFHWEMYELIEDGFTNPDGGNGKLLFLAPRNHAKTTILESVFLQKIGLNNLLLTQMVSSTQTLAEKRVGKVADCIRFNKRYIGMFGELYVPDGNFTWNNTELEVFRDRERVWDSGSEERDPTVAAIGVTSSVEGGRAHLQGYDDIVSRKNSASKILRQTVSDEFWTSFDPMLLPGGVQIFMGTRYHFGDFYSELIPKLDLEGRYPELNVVEVGTDEDEE
jgi:hypothetical protein